MGAACQRAEHENQMLQQNIAQLETLLVAATATVALPPLSSATSVATQPSSSSLRSLSLRDDMPLRASTPLVGSRAELSTVPPPQTSMTATAPVARARSTASNHLGLNKHIHGKKTGFAEKLSELLQTNVPERLDSARQSVVSLQASEDRYHLTPPTTSGRSPSILNSAGPSPDSTRPFYDQHGHPSTDQHGHPSADQNECIADLPLSPATASSASPVVSGPSSQVSLLVKSLRKDHTELLAAMLLERRECSLRLEDAARQQQVCRSDASAVMATCDSQINALRMRLVAGDGVIAQQGT